VNLTHIGTKYFIGCFSDKLQEEGLLQTDPNINTDPTLINDQNKNEIKMKIFNIKLFNISY